MLFVYDLLCDSFCFSIFSLLNELASATMKKLIDGLKLIFSLLNELVSATMKKLLVGPKNNKQYNRHQQINK